MKLDFALPKFLNLMIKRFRAIRKPIKRKREWIGRRNGLCRCGSLMKFKHCCLLKKQKQDQKQMTARHIFQRKIEDEQRKKRLKP